MKKWTQFIYVLNNMLYKNESWIFFVDLPTVKLHIKLAKTITHPQPPSGGLVFVFIISYFSQIL